METKVPVRDKARATPPLKPIQFPTIIIPRVKLLQFVLHPDEVFDLAVGLEVLACPGLEERGLRVALGRTSLLRCDGGPRLPCAGRRRFRR